MIPELAFVMLACARIGAVHSVVFAGFSSEALRDRILDGKSKWVFTADQGRRGGRTIPLKKTTDEGASVACAILNPLHPFGARPQKKQAELISELPLRRSRFACDLLQLFRNATVLQTCSSINARVIPAYITTIET